MGLFHMTSSDSPGYCHANQLIIKPEGLSVFMDATFKAGQGGSDGAYVTEVGMGIDVRTTDTWDHVPAWAEGHAKGGFINAPRFNQRVPFVGDYFDQQWVGTELAWNDTVDGDFPFVVASYSMQVWLNVSLPHEGGAYDGKCDLTMRIVCDSQDSDPQTISGWCYPYGHVSYHPLILMITGGLFQEGTTPQNSYQTAFIVNTLNITEQP